MDINLRTDQSSQASVDHESSGRPPDNPVPSMPVVPDDTTRPGPAQQPQTRVFTLFKRLPVELRFLIWEFACAPARPRIHFLEPIAKPDEDGRVLPWYRSQGWRQDRGITRGEKAPGIHWETSKYTNDPCFQWSGRELLSVCIEARRVFLDQKTKGLLTSCTEQTQVERSNMVQTTDIICVRAGVAMSRSSNHPLYPREFGEPAFGFCHRDERLSPHRLALELPAAAYPAFRRWPYHSVVPNWLGYNAMQTFMRFNRLKVVYILDQHIKPRTQYDHQEGMPHEMYNEAFESHHGSKFVAIDPEDKQAMQHWIIPEHCRVTLESARYFPAVECGRDDLVLLGYPADSPPDDQLMFLACVKEGLQTQPIDDGSPKSAFAFVSEQKL